MLVWDQHHVAAVRRWSLDTTGPADPMKSGRWTRSTAFLWPPASACAGCGSRTRPAAPSCGLAFFPEGHWALVGATAVQAELRQAFRRWGRPERVRIDNGCPWGSTGELPTELALWLFGLGIAVTWIPPRRPQQNGVVERTQGVSKGWSEPGTCATPAELQQRLEWSDDIHRNQYPSIAGRSRAEAFPGLSHSGSEYSLKGERHQWSLEQALLHLAEYVVVRRVSRDGKVSLYDRGHWIGKQWAGQLVYVSLDPDLCEWVFAAEDGREIRRRPASELTRENIIGLCVARPRGRARPEGQEQP